MVYIKIELEGKTPQPLKLLGFYAFLITTLHYEDNDHLFLVVYVMLKKWNLIKK